MGQNQKRVIIVTMIVFIAFSIISFVLPINMNGVFWISYVFAIFSIFAQLYVLKVAFLNSEAVKSRIYGFPIAQIGVFYMLIQLVLSLIFMLLSTIVPIWVPIILYVLLLMCASIGFISADAVRDEIEHQDIKVKLDTSCMMNLRAIVYSLPIKCDNKATKKVLQDLADKFKYSDPVSSEILRDVEEQLKNVTEELSRAVTNEQNELIGELARKTEIILLERNRLCKFSKK